MIKNHFRWAVSTIFFGVPVVLLLAAVSRFKVPDLNKRYFCGIRDSLRLYAANLLGKIHATDGLSYVLRIGREMNYDQRLTVTI